MRGVWLYVDGKAMALVAGRSNWRVVHAIGAKQFTRKDSHVDKVLDWAQGAFVGTRFELAWGDEELPQATAIDLTSGSRQDELT